ncbi:hypothetical protein BHECKSOX2_1452 [Bathymodiolus heckerae thiotrophic gill symbiont]|nr:hypothetical protein BHECKSOX2_1452 [Bathymodiolus heckerae thiotrophic gill symbiont]
MLFYKRWKILYQISHKNKQVLVSLIVDSNRDFNNVILTETFA